MIKKILTVVGVFVLFMLLGGAIFGGLFRTFGMPPLWAHGIGAVIGAIIVVLCWAFGDDSNEYRVGDGDPPGAF